MAGPRAVAHRSALTGALHEGASKECWSCANNIKARPDRCRPMVDLVPDDGHYDTERRQRYGTV